jgi:hypothetical protein
MLTVKPDTRAGDLILLNDKGDPVGTGIARASLALPGYVTLILVEEKPDGKKESWAFRVPANWPAELDQLRTD